MKIAIDATPVGIETPDRGGVYRYVWELLRALSAMETEDRFALFFDGYARCHRPVRAAALRDLKLGPNFRSAPARLPAILSRHLKIPVEVHTGPFDLYHGTRDHLPRTVRGRKVVTIHDVRYLDDELEEREARDFPSVGRAPEWMADRENRKRLMDQLRRSAAHTVASADRIVTVSSFCKGEIERRLGVEPDKIRVVHHGVDRAFMERKGPESGPLLDRLGIAGPYLLYVGKFDPLKNLDRLVEAFGILRGRRRVSLVLAGPPNWYRDLIRERIHASGLSDSVVLPGFVSDAELPILYSGAAAFVLPTLYEGFGLPVIEAMACGVPVVTSNTTALPEITAGAAVAVDPANVEELADAMERILEDEALRERCRRDGLRRASDFTWEACAAGTLAVYREAVDGGGRKRS